MRFAVGERDFEVDGRPVRLLSGALHYFRVHEAQWGHRLAVLRAMGLNCVETYVPWNWHEPRPGEMRDVGALGRFLDAAGAAGLWAIVRPGPYICAEWENGGLPAWLTGALGRRVRTRDAAFLRAVDGWWEVLLPQVVARQCDRGGPVVLVQVENEYGSYGSDAAYLAHLAGRLRGLGVTVPLCTSDGAEDHMLTGGSVPGVLATVNFGSGARAAFAALRRHRARGPLMCMEFWCGWFAHWGRAGVPRAARDAAVALREVLECGASVNVYMAHGGTSFGGWAGANRAGELQDGALLPTVTSYDYGAPVDERGRPTEKFWRMREVLARFAEGPLPAVPEPEPVVAGPLEVALSGWLSADAVVAALGDPEVCAGMPPTFEELGVDRGVVRYRVAVPGPRAAYPLRVSGLRDLATVYVDGVRAGVLTEDEPVLAGPVAGPAEVELWVESLGRVNYGPRLGEAKGITGGVLHERQYLHGVRARGLRLAVLDGAAGAVAVAGLGFGAPAAGARGLHRGTVTVPVGGVGDAVLELEGWTRGFAWVGGFPVGRYWSAGPQRGLFVPGPVLREGVNEVLVLELEGPEGADGAAGAPRLVP
ncbi:glycoside hydrolase family 35 protein [Streptomyces noursei]|uniref:glycoside hydrolase family 35 protein n=1 Tax=Streptomyces noursei TaxID=1971 RepID=UPI001671D44B|nr:beta-galactosidase family protein [Streptomyces noursei]MCZ1015185.1 beta-galactosidase [Streptomyces noursei]GGX03855.1 beta-galactosidase [Streptomyces noursei]